MGMEGEQTPSTPTTQPLAPTDFNGNGQRPLQTISQEGHRESKVQQIYQQTFLGTQEGLRGDEDYFRPITPEQLHSDQLFQDANTERGETPAPTRSLDNLLGSERRFLASVSSQNLPSIPGVQVQEPELEVQGNALWPQHCPPGLYETYRVHSDQIGRGEHLVSPIPGRPPDHCSLRRGLPNENEEDHRDSSVTGLAYQFGEIQIDTKTDVRMARDPVQPVTLQSTEYQPTVPKIQRCAEKHLSAGLVYQKKPYGYPGNRKLVGSSRPITQNCDFTIQGSAEGTQTDPSKSKTSIRQQTETSYGKVVTSTKQFCTPRDTRTKHDHPVRCFKDGDRLYNQLSQIPHGSGQLYDGILHKCPRTASHLDGNSDDQSEKHNPENPDRQLNCTRSDQQSLLRSISPGFHNRDDMEESINNEVDYLSSPHQRILQRDCRPTVSQHNNINRVVSPETSLQTTSAEARTQTGGGPVCNMSKPPTGKLRLSMPGSKGKGNQRSKRRLGKVGSPISFSTSTFDFEGFTKAETVKHKKRSVSHSGQSVSKVVHTTKVTAYTNLKLRGKTTASSSRQVGNGHEDFQSSRLEVLRAANSSEFPECDDLTINLMTETIRKSSEGDYQYKWSTFLDYVHSKGLTFQDIDKGLVVKFLSYLFHTRGLKPSTVSHYRSALSRPLFEFFGINLNCQKIQYLLRGMKIRRPHEPSPKPQWSLTKVLSFLESSTISTETSSLRKTAFLLLLATGWRISEIHACVREEDFCSFTERNSLRIKPHTSFLAKNGLRKRIETREIRTLLGADGKVSKVCPVSALKEYLSLTDRQKSGSLFSKPNDGRPLTLPQLRQQICSLITEADPDTRAKVHDIRKYAASITLQQDMIVGDLIEDFNWSSPATFYKFYFMQTEHPGMPISIPARS